MRASSEVSAAARSGADRVGAVVDLGVSRFMNGLPLLSILTFVPLLGGLVVVGLGAEQKRLARWLSLGLSFAALALALMLWHRFSSTSGDLQFEERHSWIPTLGVEYRVGVDGLGLLDRKSTRLNSSHL